MKNIVTLTEREYDKGSFSCETGEMFLLCREGVSAAFPEAESATSLTVEARLKPLKARGERKVTVSDLWNVRVGRKNFDMTPRRTRGLARVLGLREHQESFTFFVSLKK
jgi:hypothetical protein